MCSDQQEDWKEDKNKSSKKEMYAKIPIWRKVWEEEKGWKKEKKEKIVFNLFFLFFIFV